MVKQGVRLVRGGLSGQIYAVTRWKADPDRGPEAWEALEKFDVTDQFYRIADTLGFPMEPPLPTQGDDLSEAIELLHRVRYGMAAGSIADEEIVRFVSSEGEVN